MSSFRSGSSDLAFVCPTHRPLCVSLSGSFALVLLANRQGSRTIVLGGALVHESQETQRNQEVSDLRSLLSFLISLCFSDLCTKAAPSQLESFSLPLNALAAYAPTEPDPPSHSRPTPPRLGCNLHNWAGRRQEARTPTRASDPPLALVRDSQRRIALRIIAKLSSPNP